MLLALRHSLRPLLSQPGFSALVILTLGLAIGAAATVFSLFDAILLRPFPFEEPDRLVRLRMEQPALANSETDVSIPDFWDWRREAKSFRQMGAYLSVPTNLAGDGPAQPIRLSFASPELFSVLGVSPALGRTYAAADDRLGGNVHQAVISHRLWKQHFSGRADVVGQPLRIRGETYAVTGVMPAGFDYPERTEVWVPLMARYATVNRDWWKRRDMRPHVVLARLAPHVTVEQARTEMQALTRAQGLEFPDTNRRFAAKVVTLREAETGAMRPYVLLVAAAVLLLLSVGCVNVANLFIARAAAREKEFAVRSALGAGQFHLIRQLLGETGWYALGGCLCGVALAYAGVGGLTALIPVPLPQWMSLRLDARVILFAVAASAATALVFGLAPLLHSFRSDPAETLKQGIKGSSGGGLAGRLRSALVVIEVALSVVLLIGAGLLTRSFANLMAIESGIRTEKLVVAPIFRYLPNATPEQAYRGYALEVERIREQLATLPGVRSVAGGNDVPYLNRPEQRRTVEIYTRQRATKDSAYRGPAAGADVTPGYFDTMGIPLLAGRDFTSRDNLTAPKAIIVSERSADLLFGRKNVVGEQIRWGNDQDYDPWTTVIGVVGNTRWHPAEKQPGVEVYWAYAQYPSPNTNLVIRTTTDPPAVLEAVRRVVQQVNPDFAVEQVKTMDTVVTESIWQRRLWSFVLATFALLALTLASVGLYGVMSFVVAQRTRELGIRLAIGAPASSVLHLVLGQGASLVLFGAVLGLGAAFFAGRYVEQILFGVAPFDPLTFAVVPGVLLAVALIACALPAWRAARIDPLIALRQE